MLLQNRKDYLRLEDDGKKIYVLETSGGLPYVSMSALAERWGLSVKTVRKYVGEIEAITKRKSDVPHLNGRYPEEAILGVEKSKRVNEFVFADYYGHRTILRDKTMAGYIKPFSPSRYAALMGYFNRPVREWDGHELKLPESTKRKKEKEEAAVRAFKELIAACG